MAEAGGDQGAEVFGLDLAGNGDGQALPGVAGALDDFDGVAHGIAHGLRRGTDEGIKRTGRPGQLRLRRVLLGSLPLVAQRLELWGNLIESHISKARFGAPGIGLG